MDDSKCRKRLFSCSSARGKSYPPKLKCITTDVANDFTSGHQQGGVLPTQTQVHDSRCCKWLFSSPLARGSLTYLNSSALLQKLQTTFFLPISKRRVLPTQTQVHDCRCCKWLFSSSLARVSPIYLNSSTLLQMLQTIFLLTISNRGVLPNQTQVHDYRWCKWLYHCRSARRESYPTKLKCMTTDDANDFSPAH